MRGDFGCPAINAARERTLGIFAPLPAGRWRVFMQVCGGLSGVLQVSGLARLAGLVGAACRSGLARVERMRGFGSRSGQRGRAWSSRRRMPGIPSRGVDGWTVMVKSWSSGAWARMVMAVW
jgi:hypothetical protein